MANNKAFAYNPSNINVDGTINVGDLAIGFKKQSYANNFSGLTWWGGPDEDQGYVIAYPQPSNTHPTPLGLNWNPNRLGSGNTLSNSNRTITNTGYNTSVLGTNFITGSTLVMYSISVEQTVNGVIGFGKDDMNLSSYVGSDDFKSIGFSFDGYLYYGGNVIGSSLPTWGINRDIVDICADTINDKIWIRVNNGNWNNDGNQNPSNNVSDYSLQGLSDFYPAITSYREDNTSEVLFLTQPEYSVPGEFTYLTRIFASVGFWGTKNYVDPFDDQTFLNLAQNVTNQTFTSAVNASNWLWDNGYWNSYYSPIIVKLDASNTLSYSGSGSVWYDLTDNSNNGTIVNATYNSVSGGTFYFDGDDDYVSIGQPISGGSSYSICAWVNVRDAIESRNIVSSENTPFWVANSNLYAGLAGNYTLVEYSNFPSDQWMFVSVTFDDPSNTMKLYVNGVLEDTNTNVTSSYSAEDMYIGSHFYSGVNVSFWSGYISKVYIFSAAQRDDEILALFNRTKSQYGF